MDPNEPVLVTKEEVTNYVKWIAKRLGDSGIRVPTVEELLVGLTLPGVVALGIHEWATQNGVLVIVDTSSGQVIEPGHNDKAAIRLVRAKS